MPGRRDSIPAHQEQGQAPERLQGERRHVRSVRAEAQMHGQQDGPPGAPLLRGGLRRPGQGLPRDLPLREGAAQEKSVGGAPVRRGQRPTRAAEIQAQTAGEGKHGDLADRRRSERQASAHLRAPASEEDGPGRGPAVTVATNFLRRSRDAKVVFGRQDAPSRPFCNSLLRFKYGDRGSSR